MLRGMSAL